MKLDPALRRPVLMTLLALACLVLGAALLLDWISIDRPLPALGGAVATQATISGNRMQPGEWSRGRLSRKGEDRYFLEVTFATTHGKVQTSEIEVGQAHFNAHLPGGRVTVWYFPERPHLNVLDDPAKLAGKRSRFGQLLGWILAGVGAAGLVIYGNKLHVARGGQSVL